ncbi:hypothetical protein GGF32_006933 [Allomyces javanicus]|nr:hypothetical protein GGF32_006933 [Allomyces javanicus]
MFEAIPTDLQADYHRLLVALMHRVNEDIAAITDPREKRLYHDVFNSVAGKIPIQVLDAFVDVMLPVGHLFKRCELLRIHGPERCGKSGFTMAPMLISQSDEFLAIFSYGSPAPRCGGVRPLIITGPGVKNEVNNLLARSKALEEVGLEGLQYLTGTPNPSSMTQLSVVFGNHARQTKCLHDICVANVTAKVHPRAKYNYNVIVCDEGDLMLGQGHTFKGGQIGFSETETWLRKARCVSTTTGTILITATDISTYTPPESAMTLYDKLISLSYIGDRRISESTLVIQPASDYIGLEALRGDRVSIEEFDVDKSNVLPGIKVALTDAIDKYKAKDHIVVSPRDPAAPKRLVQTMLVMADRLISSNKDLAREYSDDSTVCIAYCDKDRFTAYHNGAELKVHGVKPTTTLPEFYVLVITAAGPLARGMPRIITFAYAAAQRGTTFQFTIKGTSGIRYLGYVASEFFYFNRTARGEATRSYESIKQQLLRFATRLYDFEDVFETSDLDFALTTNCVDAVNDIFNTEDYARGLRTNSALACASNETLKVISGAKRRLDMQQHQFQATKRARVDVVEPISFRIVPRVARPTEAADAGTPPTETWSQQVISLAHVLRTNGHAMNVREVVEYLHENGLLQYYEGSEAPAPVSPRHFVTLVDTTPIRSKVVSRVGHVLCRNPV